MPCALNSFSSKTVFFFPMMWCAVAGTEQVVCEVLQQCFRWSSGKQWEAGEKRLGWTWMSERTRKNRVWYRVAVVRISLQSLDVVGQIDWVWPLRWGILLYRGAKDCTVMVKDKLVIYTWSCHRQACAHIEWLWPLTLFYHYNGSSMRFEWVMNSSKNTGRSDRLGMTAWWRKLTVTAGLWNRQRKSVDQFHISMYLQWLNLFVQPGTPEE
jgi:hypothetical protein